MAREFKFVVRGRREKVTIRDVLVLVKDNWDDYGHKVQFHLVYIDEGGDEIRIGSIKILCVKKAASKEVVSTTSLPDSFSELNEGFISLGQEDDYYKELWRLFKSDAESVLVALRDIAWQPQLAHQFEPTTAFRNALMRYNTAHRARRFGRAWVLGQTAQESVEFSYSCTIDGADGPIDVGIAFDGEDRVPGRVVAIIGRNAVGKTQFLAHLGEDLAQIERLSAGRLEKRDQRFPDGRPLFTRIIAISYSAFDRFKRPRANAQSSYVYCGIRNSKGALSRASLIEAYRENQKRIRDLGRESEWTAHMQSILGDHSGILTAGLDDEIASPNTENEKLSLLSSGQSILSHFVTAFLAWIQPNSLVLFDEPETHLHPNAVANLFMVLTEMLRTYDSYAIVATHSPVVIQELPSSRVVVFRREDNLTTAEELPLESFGESVSELTRHVFETIEVESLYRTTLRNLASTESFDEVIARFPLGLSLSAQAYLLAKYEDEKE